MQNSFIAIAMLLILTGCATPEPVIQTIIQKVEVPILVPCKQEIPSTPDFNFDKLTESDTLFDKTKSLLADKKIHLAYEEELLAALKACKDPKDSVK